MRSIAYLVAVGGLVMSCSSAGEIAPTADPRDGGVRDGNAAAVQDTKPSGEAGTSGGAGAYGNGDADAAVDGAAVLPGWTLTWSDEFDTPDGSPVDPTKWSHETGGGGWGNSEREYYTAGTENAVIQGGNLVVTATPNGASSYACWYGACRYTSARLITQGHFEQQYGRVEARIRIPTGQGLWPAFWMLGSNIGQANVGWPACGEIDVMENIGREPSTNHGSLHAPGADLTGKYTLPSSTTLSGAFHTFAVEWEVAAIRFYVDDQLYETQTPGQVPAGGTWAFNHPFFILLNVAVGGTWPGDPDTTTTFPQTMLVDWVRVYVKNGTEP